MASERAFKPKWIAAVFVLLILASVPLAYWAYQDREFKKKLRPVNNVSAPTLVRIRERTTPTDLVESLSNKGLIRDKRAFMRWLTLNGIDRKLAQGDYEFSPDMSGFRIAEMLQKRETTLNWITLPEGLMLRQVAERMERNGICTAAEFNQAALQPSRFAGKVGFPLPSKTLEGFLMPGTYRVPPKSGADAAIEALLKGFEREAYEPLKAEASRAGRSWEQTVNVAAMIEREAMHEKDRPLIASVIYNRLSKNMRLQIDATIQYAYGDWKHKVTLEDYKIDSPYSTYHVKGLPPNPICNPGLACLRAAVNPADTPYLYYVALPSGYHLFTATYEEHRNAINEANKQKRQQTQGGA